MKRRGRWAEHPNEIHLHSLRGVIRAMTLESLGMHSKVIYRRCLPGGPWRRLLPGIILLHNNNPTQDELVDAALLYAGPEALVTGAEACRRYGLHLPEEVLTGRVHVLIPHHHKAVSSGHVTVERTLRLPERWQRQNVPLAPLVRSTTDLVRRLRRIETVGQVLVEAIQRGRCAPQALAEELDRGTKRGTAIPRRVLREWAEVRSVAEATAQRLARLLPVPPTHQNIELYDGGGEYVGCPDFWWDDVGLAWEIDSVEFHYRSGDYARTLRRNTRYAMCGVAVVQTLPSRLKSDSNAVSQEVRAAYLTASSRPRPAISLRDAA